MNNDKDLLGSLFDLSFTSFITTKLIKVLFVLAIILSAIGAVIIIIGSFANGLLAGLGGLVLGALLFFVYVLAARVWLELIIVVFRIAENVSIIAESKKPTVVPPVPSADPPSDAGQF